MAYFSDNIENISHYRGDQIEFWLQPTIYLVEFGIREYDFYYA